MQIFAGYITEDVYVSINLRLKQERESTGTAAHDCFFVGQHWKHCPHKCTLTHQWSEWDFELEINAVLMLNSCPKYCPTVLNRSCCLLVPLFVRRKAEAGIKLWIDIAGWQVGWAQLLVSYLGTNLLYHLLTEELSNLVFSPYGNFHSGIKHLCISLLDPAVTFTHAMLHIYIAEWSCKLCTPVDALRI